MGRGNSIIRDRQGIVMNTFYVNYYEHDDFTDEETGESYCNNNPCICNDTFLDDFTGNIYHTFKNKFKHVDNCYQNEETYQDDWRNYYSVIFRTNIFEVAITDNETCIAIGCIPIYNDNGNFNDYIFKKSANKFMKLLGEIYNDITIRTGPWTSGKITNNEYYG